MPVFTLKKIDEFILRNKSSGKTKEILEKAKTKILGFNELKNLSKTFSTDLAIEARDMYTKENKRELDGVVVDEEKEGDIKITTVTIESDEAGEELGKPKGNYITIDIPEFTHYDGESMDEVSKVVGNVLSRLINMPEEKTALVVGLGNVNLIADALGSKVIENIEVTRHIKKYYPEYLNGNHVNNNVYWSGPCVP